MRVFADRGDWVILCWREVRGASAEVARAVGERSDRTAVIGGMVVRGASAEVARAVGEVCVGRSVCGRSDGRTAVVGGMVVRGASAEVARVVVVGVLRKVGVVIRNDGHDGMIV